jgi:(R,R)-butanediol dehydrogenase/meso-butanediol dehydrogenase/diacetyl reductase
MTAMKAAYITGKAQIEVREAEAPSAGAGEVVLRVRACGICGTDLHFYHGDLPAMASLSPGHEFSGEVVELGDGVEGFAEGERVAVEPIIRCGRCTYCQTGQYQLCPKRVLIGAFHQGALAEYIVVPAYTLYRLPDELDFDLGAFAEPMAVSVHGVHLANVSAGDKVLVLGTGTIGLTSIMAARAAGAGEIIATYRHEHQGKAALAVGADRIVSPDEVDPLQSESIDVVIETIGGKAPTLEQALHVVRLGGWISVLGLFTQNVPLNALSLMRKEARIVGGITYCRPGHHSDFDVALGILKVNQESARALITHKFALDDVAKAFETAADKSSGSIKVQVRV